MPYTHKEKKTVVEGTCKIQQASSIEVEFQTPFKVNKSGFAYDARCGNS